MTAARIHSPSGIATARQCRRKWWLRYGEGVKPREFTWAEVLSWDAYAALPFARKRAVAVIPTEPRGAARSLALGKEVHRLAEIYLQTPRAVVRKKALIDWQGLPGQCLAELLHHLPPAGSVRRRDIERAFVVTASNGVRFRGLIDLVTRAGEGRIGGVLVEEWAGAVNDHKTSGDILQYALLPHAVARKLQQRWDRALPAELRQHLKGPETRSLRDDLQACTYVVATGLELARWNYTETKKIRRSLPVVQHIPLAHAREILDEGAVLARELDGYTTREDAPPNTLACDDYGGCWYRQEGHCTVKRKLGQVLAHNARKAEEQEHMSKEKNGKKDTFAALERDTAAANEAEERAARRAARAKAAAAAAEADRDDDEPTEPEDDAPESEAPESEEVPESRDERCPESVEADARHAKRVRASKVEPAPVEADEDAAPESEDAPAPAPKPRARRSLSPRAAAKAAFDAALPDTSEADARAARKARVESTRGALQLALGAFVDALCKAVGA